MAGKDLNGANAAWRTHSLTIWKTASHRRGRGVAVAERHVRRLVPAGLVVTLRGAAPEADVSVATREFSAPSQVAKAVAVIPRNPGHL